MPERLGMSTLSLELGKCCVGVTVHWAAPVGCAPSVTYAGACHMLSARPDVGTYYCAEVAGLGYNMLGLMPCLLVPTLNLSFFLVPSNAKAVSQCVTLLACVSTVPADRAPSVTF